MKPLLFYYKTDWIAWFKKYTCFQNIIFEMRFLSFGALKTGWDIMTNTQALEVDHHVVSVKAGCKWHQHDRTVVLVYQRLLSSPFYSKCKAASILVCVNSQGNLDSEGEHDKNSWKSNIVVRFFWIVFCFFLIRLKANWESAKLQHLKSCSKTTVAWCGCWFWVPHMQQKGT